MASMCFAATGRAEEVTLYHSRMSYCNGASSDIFPLLGKVSFNGVKKGSKAVKSSVTYATGRTQGHAATPIYCAGVTEDGSTVAIYRKPAVHIVIALSDGFHRELYLGAILRHTLDPRRSAASTPMAHVHHIDGNKKNNRLYNLLPLSPTEHSAVHKAMRRGASIYEALCIALGAELVHEIFGNYFLSSLTGVSIAGTPYVDTIAQMLSDAALPADCCTLIADTPRGATLVDVHGLNVWHILSTLYGVGATGIYGGIRRMPMRRVSTWA